MIATELELLHRMNKDQFCPRCNQLKWTIVYLEMQRMQFFFQQMRWVDPSRNPQFLSRISCSDFYFLNRFMNHELFLIYYF